MGASALDRLEVAKAAYNAAKADGKTEDEALDAARAAVKRKRAEQVLRSANIHGERLQKALDDMGY